MVLGASLIAFCILVSGLWHSKPSKDLPSTPTLAFKELVTAMRKKENGRISEIATPSLVKELASFQGENASTIEVHHFLLGKGVDPKQLKEPWELWKHWAQTVDFHKVTIDSNNATGTQVLIQSGNADYINFIFEKKPEGWLLTDLLYGVTY